MQSSQSLLILNMRQSSNQSSQDTEQMRKK